MVAGGVGKGTSTVVLVMLKIQLTTERIYIYLLALYSSTITGLDQHQLVNWEMILIHGLKLNLTTPWLLTPPISLGGCIKRMSMAIASLIAMSRVLIFWQASLKVRDWSQGRLDQSKDKHRDPIDI